MKCKYSKKDDDYGLTSILSVNKTTENPFDLKQKKEVFQLREEERLRRLKVKEDCKHLKIWQKGKSGSRAEESRASWIKNLLKDTNYSENKKKRNEKVETNHVAKITDFLDKYMETKFSGEKEHLANFIAKKRDIFLLQLSLNIKKEEIQKYDKKVRIKDEVLGRNEQILDEDARCFDSFLKENDKKAQEAIRKAENKSKNKIEKIQEIRKMNQHIQLIQSAMRKNKDRLDDCLKFKIFLENLVPKKWIESQKDQILKTRVDSSSKPNAAEETINIFKQESPMYFHHPKQLLDIFSRLEEENLFLIQNTQEAEESLDEMISHFSDTKIDVKKRTCAMEEHINHINSNILNKEETIRKESDFISINSNILQKDNEAFVAEIYRSVKEIYHRCGFSDTGAEPSTLFMLSDIEAGMENILTKIEMIPMELIKTAEKIKEKKRREDKRSQQQKEQTKIQEERNKKVIERSLQPPKKRKGKQIMFRSGPTCCPQVQKENIKLTQDDIDEMKHLRHAG